MGLCGTCHGGCCRAFAVPISGSDILRIMTRPQTTFWDVACRWEDAEGKIAGNLAPHFHFSDEPETPFVICLLRSPSQQFPGTECCKFLQELPASSEAPLGRSECGIYHERPGACRIFPATLDDDERITFRDTGCSAATPPALRLCPRPWQMSDSNPLQILQDLRSAGQEMRLFHEFAAAWNRRPQEWLLFPSILEQVYHVLALRESDQLRRAA